MKPVWWMAALSGLSALVVSMAFGAAVEVWLGMIAPLGVVTASWVKMARVFQEKPESLTAVMMAAFFAKLVFFGAYVAFVVSVLQVRPVPFVASFTSYFIALYAAEAVCLQRLFSERMRTA